MRHVERERESFTQILELTPAMRGRIEAALDGLLGLLDAMDAPTADMEDDDPPEGGFDDEPSLGGPEAARFGHYDQRGWFAGGDQDLEDEHDGREEESAI